MKKNLNKGYRYKILCDWKWLGAYLVVWNNNKYQKIELHYAFGTS